jgi:CheY-like chemotaxis protein
MKTILLADDDSDDCLMFENALKEISLKTSLTIAQDGSCLMEELEKNVTDPPPPHVIFLDLNMPGKNGFECLNEIRETPKLKDIPVVIFSTSSNKDAIDRTYRQGANHYISKPTSFRLLVTAIETVLHLDMWQQPRASREDFVLAIA